MEHDDLTKAKRIALIRDWQFTRTAAKDFAARMRAASPEDRRDRISSINAMEQAERERVRNLHARAIARAAAYRFDRELGD